MSLVNIVKNKIAECNEIINQDLQSYAFKEKVSRGVIPADKIAHFYEHSEMQSAEFRRTYPALMMQKNKAKQDLEELNFELKQIIKNNTKLFLVLDDKFQIKNLLKDKVCFEMHHEDMAKKIATFVIPAIRCGDVLNSNLIAVINDVLDNVEDEIGIVSALSPRLELKSDCIESIENIEKLTKVIEYMLETQMTPTEDISEGHVMQAIFNAKQYLDYALNEDNEKNYVCVVYVPHFGSHLVDAYSKFLSSNIKTVDCNDRTSVVEFLEKLPVKIETESAEVSKKTRKNKA